MVFLACILLTSKYSVGCIGMREGEILCLVSICGQNTNPANAETNIELGFGVLKLLFGTSF
jgi:hypothetical protein